MTGFDYTATRMIETDGTFIYASGYERVFDPKTRDCVMNSKDIALIGAIGTHRELVLPAYFGKRKIALIRDFKIYETVNGFRPELGKMSTLAYADSRRWWDPTGRMYLLPDELRMSATARCDSITIPEVYLQEGAFRDLRVRRVTFESSKKQLPAALFENCGELREVVFREGAAQIPCACFARCNSLKTVELPKSLKAIKSEAFKESGLSELIIPDGVKRIAFRAFSGCRELTAVVIPSSIEKIASNAFECCSSLTIVAPLGSYGQSYAHKHGITFIPYEAVIAEVMKSRIEKQKRVITSDP